MRTLVVSLGLVFWIWGAGAGTGWAGPANKPSSSAQVQKAKKLAEAGKLREALSAYQEAYALRQDPQVMREIGKLHRRLGQLREALAIYELLLRNDPLAKAPDRAELAAFAERVRAALRGREELKQLDGKVRALQEEQRTLEIEQLRLNERRRNIEAEQKRLQEALERKQKEQQELER